MPRESDQLERMFGFIMCRLFEVSDSALAEAENRRRFGLLGTSLFRRRRERQGWCWVLDPLQ